MLPAEDKSLVNMLQDWFRSSESARVNYSDSLTRNLGYYSGRGHFSFKDWQEAQKENPPRALIQVNNVFKYLNMMSGFERQTRQDIRCFPVGQGSDALLADILSVIMKQIDTESYGHYVRSDLYLNAQIADRSHIRWKLKFDRFWPIITQETIDPRLVYEDPEGTTYDESGHRFISLSNWMWEEEIAKRFASNPDEAREIKERLDKSSVRDDRLFFQPMGQYKKARVLEFQYKEFERGIMGYNPQTGETHDSLTEDQAVQAKLSGWTILFDSKAKTKIAKISGDMLLETMDHPCMRNGQFDITRYSPYFAMGADVSMVDQVISQQDEVNANRSAMRDLVARAPKGTVIYTSFAGLNETDLKNISTIGGTFKVNDIDQIKIIDTSPYYNALTAFAQLSDRSSVEFREIFGITPEFMGQLKSSTSGIVFERAVSQASIGLEMALDNFRRTQKMHFKKLIPIIQKYFPMNRIMRLTDDQYPFLQKQAPEGQQIAYAQMQPGLGSPAELNLMNQYNEVVKKINVDPTIGEYDVIVDFGRSAVSQMNYNLSLAMEMVRNMPPETLIELMPAVIGMTNFPNKEIWVEKIQGIQDRNAQLGAIQQAYSEQGQAQGLETQGAEAELMRAQAMRQMAEADKDEPPKNGKKK